MRRSLIVVAIVIAACLFVETPIAREQRATLVPLVTDQTPLPLSNRFEVTSGTDINQAGDFAFASAGAALFLRRAGTSVPLRIYQAGDEIPGLPGSRGDFVQGIDLNELGHVAFKVDFYHATGITQGAILVSDGTALRMVVSGLDTAPDSAGATFGRTLDLVGLNDRGDVAFTAPLVEGGIGLAVRTTLFLIPAGGAPVRVAGLDDVAPNTGGGKFASITARSLNNSGEVSFGGSLSGGVGGGGAFVGGAGGVRKIVANGDPIPAAWGPGVFSIPSGYAGMLNSAGQVAFTANNAIWISSPPAGTITRVVALGEATPGLPATTLTFSLGVSAFNDDGVVAFYSYIDGLRPPPARPMGRFRAWPGGARELVAYDTMTLLGTTATLLSTGWLSMNSAGTVSFLARLSEGAATSYAIYRCPAGGTLTPVVVEGTSTPPGGGLYSLADTAYIRTLDTGAVYFRADVVGGAGDYGEFLATDTETRVLMSTADELPAGAHTSFRGFKVNGAGDYVGFVAHHPGGRWSLVTHHIASHTTTVAVTDGDPAPGGTVRGLNGNSVYVNSAGAVAFISGSTAASRTILLAAGGTLNKIVAVGDSDLVSGMTVTSLSFNSIAPSPLNDAGQVVFQASVRDWGNSRDGLFVRTASGATTKVALVGEAAPGGRAFSSMLGSPWLNQSGQVAFQAGTRLLPEADRQGLYIFTPGATPAVVKVAETGDAAGFASFGPPAFNDRGQIVFMAKLANGTGGVFVGSSADDLTALALDGQPAPAGGVYSITSVGPEVQINNQEDVVFRAALTGGSANAGYFVRRGPTGPVQKVVLQGEPAPGTSGTFYSVQHSLNAFVGEHLQLDQAGNIAFSTYVDVDGAHVFCLWRVSPDGTVQALLIRGTPVPGIDDGVPVGFQSSIAWNSGGRYPLRVIMSGGPWMDGIFVSMPTPVVTWPTPTAITYGTLLSEVQLNATAIVPGTFTYSPAAGTVLNAGSHLLSVTFTPDDLVNYAPTSASVPLEVLTAASVITWPPPAGIVYGTPLSSTQLNATANVPGTSVYTPAAGEIINAGTRTLTVTFTPADANYAPATASVSIVVAKAMPLVTWPAPVAITYPTPLSGTQLNATASAAGYFTYAPALGTVLGVGTQALTTVFTPLDAANYETPPVASVSLTVNAATAALTFDPASLTRTYDGTTKTAAVSTEPPGLAPVRLQYSSSQVAAGMFHSCTLNGSGAVLCWGANANGQLGDGTTTDRWVPTPVSGLGDGVIAVAAGRAHTCAAMRAGSVKCWGDNASGQLGDGTTAPRLTPVIVSGLNEVVTALAAGHWHTCALTAAGAVKCWGANTLGQLGDGSQTGRLTPVQVLSLPTAVVGLSAGESHTCAITIDGAASCWGRNDFGQVGDGTTAARSTPTQVSGLGTGVAQLVAGWYHTCAVTIQGAARCWGRNNLGQLGDGTSGTNRWTPVLVSGLSSGVKRLAAGLEHTCAVSTAGAVKCWGSNGAQQLGDGTSQPHLTPVDVGGLTSEVMGIEAGWYHTCAVMAAGGVRCWGNTAYGMLGDNGAASVGWTPVPASGVAASLVSVASGWNHSCAVTDSGALQCWGANGDRQIGVQRSGYDVDQPAAVQVPTLTSGVIQVGGGQRHTCVLTSSGGVRCWGDGFSGQIGNGLQSGSRTPLDVTGLTSGVTALAVGGSHSCAVTAAGSVKCWGGGWNGQIGDDTRNNALSPRQVSGLPSEIRAVAAGYNHTCALTGAGAVMCWGANNYGQLGENTSDDRLTPVQVSTLTSGVKAIAAGESHTCALTTAGAVKCWGANGSGQVGNGTTADRQLVPAQVSGLSSGVVSLTAGGTHTCAVVTGGDLKCWGGNGSGQIGDGSTTMRTTPTAISSLAGRVTAVAAGRNHTCALIDSGAVRCWGQNDVYQLGDGTQATRSTPTVPIDVYVWQDTPPVEAGEYGVRATLANRNCTAAPVVDVLTILRATPVVEWPAPADIAVGIALGDAQLNATASVAGTFVYAPPADTVLLAGTHELKTTFMPTDALNYQTVTATATIDVNNTPAGAQVPVTLPSGVNLTFSSVTESGMTTVTTSPTGPATPPPGFRLGDPAVHYDISTTALHDGQITVCVNYSGITFVPEHAIALYHYEGGEWIQLPSTVDTTANVVCGVTSSLSPFAVLGTPFEVAGLAPPLGPLVPTGSPLQFPATAFKLGRTLPLKLQLSIGGVPMTNLEVGPPLIASLGIVGADPLNLDTLDLDAGQANDSGLAFRYSDGSWVYNLSTKGLSAATYVLTIQLADGRLYWAGFVLKK